MNNLLVDKIKSEFSVIPENGLKIEISFRGKGTKKLKGISKIKKSNGRTYVTVLFENKRLATVKTNLISLVIFLEGLGQIEEMEVTFSFMGVTGLKSTFTIFQS